MLAEIGILLLLVLANGFFAGAEMAVVAVRKARLATLVDERRRGARAVAALRQAPEQFLATVQIGVTVVGATAAAFGGATNAARLTPLLAEIPPLTRYAQDLAIGVVVALVSFLSLVLGELVPKSLALRSPEPVALAVARPLRALSWLARPLVWLLTKSSNLMLAPFGDRTTFIEARVSVQEISHMVEEATRSGTLNSKAGEIAARALAFGDLSAGDVMVPRNQMIAIRRDASEQELRRALLEEGHGRLPVYERTLDNVVGYLVAHEALALVWEKGLVVLEDLIRPAHFVPETARAVEVLREMQARRLQLSIVVDEHGGVAGLVTLEDLLEELVGDILAETEVASPWLTREPDGRVLLRGDVPLREVNRELGLALPEGDGYSTVAGLCIALAGGIPAPDTRVVLADGSALEVIEASARQVRRVRVTSPPRPATAE